MIRALFTTERSDFDELRQLTPQILDELGVEPLDVCRRRLRREAHERKRMKRSPENRKNKLA